MTAITEAACLLQSGTSYHRRLGFKTLDGLDVFAGVKSCGVSLYFADDPIFHFDFDGRWQRAFVDGVHYLKGLDATVRTIDREREAGGMVLRRKILPYGQAVDLDASIRSIALNLIDDLDCRRVEILETPSPAHRFETEEFRNFLERVVVWDSAAWFAHREGYLSTYGLIPFLPPDRLQDLVLQATLGNTEGRAFGGAQTSELYVRSLAEFEEHVQTVLNFVGRRLCQFQNLFLAGGDVLHLPPEKLLGIFEIICKALPESPKQDLPGDHWDKSSPSMSTNVFLDDPGGPFPDPATWTKLGTLGLRGVTIAVESGDPSIRALYGKIWNENDLRRRIDQIHEGGQELGLVVLIGAGGASKAVEHLDSTVQLLNAMPLRRNDLVSLVDARQLAQSPDLLGSQLSDEEVEAQFAAIKSRISVNSGSSKPKIIAYNPQKQPN